MQLNTPSWRRNASNIFEMVFLEKQTYVRVPIWFNHTCVVSRRRNPQPAAWKGHVCICRCKQSIMLSFVRGIHIRPSPPSQMNSYRKGTIIRSVDVSLNLAWRNGWTAELSVIWDAMTSLWRHYNGMWASHRREYRHIGLSITESRLLQITLASVFHITFATWVLESMPISPSV